MKGTAVPQATITSINVNPAGGVPKHAVAHAEMSITGVAGDCQRDKKHHGGPARAVSIYSAERIAALQAEGHSIAAGTTGENLTISGLDWDALAPGSRIRIGEVVQIEITGYATPCSNIIDSFAGGTITRISQKLHPGWSRLYARILTPGIVYTGDQVYVEE